MTDSSRPETLVREDLSLAADAEGAPIARLPTGAGADVLRARRPLADLVGAPQAGGDAAAAPAHLLSMRGYHLRRLLLLGDLGALAVAVIATHLLIAPNASHISLGEQLVVLAAVAPLFVVAGYFAGLYHLSERHIDHTLAEEIGPVFAVATVWTWVAMLASTAIADAQLRIARFALLWALVLAAVLGIRTLVRRFARTRPWYRQRVAVIGDRLDVRRVLRRIQRHPEWGVEPIGSIVRAGAGLSILEGEDRSGRRFEAIPMPETDPESIMEAIRALSAERVMIAGWTHTLEHRTELIRRLATTGVHVDIVSGEPEALCAGASLQHIEGMSVMTVRPAHINRAALAAKRALDVAAAGIGLTLLAPLFAYIALRIKLDSKGPVFFRQPRAGRGGEVFELVKFRTMVADADDQRPRLKERSGPHELFKLRDDPRITRYGAGLRRRSLDELPQLWNVLRGDMSIVGPRPLPLDEAHLATDHFAERISLRPGITGPWQIHGRSDIPFDDMVRLDYSYVSTWSLEEDLRLMIRTVGVVLGGRGAY